MDTPLRHRLSPGDRWPEPAPERAHRLPGIDVRGLLLDRDPRAGRLLPLQSALESLWCARGVPGPGSVSVLLLLGDDAGAHVLSHQPLGPREPGLRGDQV